MFGEVKESILRIFVSLYDLWKYGNYREMSKAEAIIELFGRKE